MWGIFIRSMEFAARQIPLVLMAWGIGCVVFFYGFLVSDRHWFPYDTLAEARQTVQFIWNRKLFGEGLPEIGSPADISPADVPKRRIGIKEKVNDGSRLLLTGGEGQFLEYCPEHGCAAVIVERDGSPIHTYPYRPEELTTKRTVDLRYGQFLHDDSQDTAVFGLAPLANGDLIVVYDFNGTMPYGGGIARMDPDGHLLWYRRDYSNHWPKITPLNEILVISHEIGPTEMRITHPVGRGHVETLSCSTGMLEDIVRVLDLDGNTKEEIPVLDAVLKSPYWTRLLVDVDPLRPVVATSICDPLHANSVVLVGEELAAKLPGVEANDLLLSLRSISALAVIGRNDHTLKRLFSGTFIYQHSAQVVNGGKIILFDNFGSSPSGGPSRVLLYDPVTGEERTIFPSKHTPKDLEIFSPFFGNIDVSADGTRALLTISMPGKAYEIGLADGRLLTTFDNLHDLRSVPQFKGSAQPVRYFTEYGVYYISPERTASP